MEVVLRKRNQSTTALHGAHGVVPTITANVILPHTHAPCMGGRGVHCQWVPLLHLPCAFFSVQDVWRPTWRLALAREDWEHLDQWSAQHSSRVASGII